MDLRAQVESIAEKILPGVEALAARLEVGPPTTAPTRLDPREPERHCRDLGLAVGHELFARLVVQEYGDGHQGPRVRCACGGTRRWVGTRPRRMRDLMTREVTLARAYYFCDACGQGWLPLDAALGLTAAQVTPALYEVAVTCGSVAPPEEAAEVLAVVAGITLSLSSVERYTQAAGAATERAVTERAAATHADAMPEPGAAAPAARPYNGLAPVSWTLFPLGEEGVHDAEDTTALSTAAPGAARRADSVRANAGGAGPTVRALRADDPELGAPGRPG